MSELLKINVNDHTERKNGLTYLSWAWAWAEALKVDPGASWYAEEYKNEHGCALPAMFLPDGSAMVKTRVTIKEHTKTCVLPVMDHRNKAIKNPDAFAINTAIMRCMTKTISMHGLGLYIYAGEDLPQLQSDEDQAAKQRQAELDELALYLIDCHQNGNDTKAIELWYDAKTWSADNPTESEEKKYVWGQLGRHHSALRSAIKANHPDRKPAEQAA
jgi:Protein of unknown function (DUF1071)